MEDITCEFFGHKYTLKRRINFNLAELCCARCRAEFAMNYATGLVLPLSDNFRVLHNELLAIHNEKFPISNP